MEISWLGSQKDFGGDVGRAAMSVMRKNVTGKDGYASLVTNYASGAELSRRDSWRFVEI